ncbi:MAG: DUF72 domain-containing protein [Armatimonadota bacterium]|nr:DUF72 domain-containing protein [Armatimonadota bacterium]MDR7436612.1 DUF72 domain-containing protein [Armatimonadota bacterium]MDR7506623.1 DUF72 domain-containing protein [Armatimonadota bacterium]MDR7509141.1 DUF72 domain-containing protein [Armatimonadota bacterium]MDR7516709.1 DUF72 domain-containing protein [Armatimonadota bacterium]
MAPASGDQTSLDLAPAARPLHVGSCRVYVGTCSWADPHFVREGQFYPPGVGTDPRRRLQYYATVFPVVEVDATYHALQPRERAAQWVEWTPPGFVFTTKAFALFTGHGTDPRRLPREIAALLPASTRSAESVSPRDLPEEVLIACWDYYAAFLEPLARSGRLGYVLFQFPKGAGFSPEILEHLDRWEPYLRRWPVAVEIRHRSWLAEPARSRFLDYLRRRGYAYVVPDMVQRAYLPPPDVELTTSWSVVRFHGRNPAMLERRAPTSRVYDYCYTLDELRPWAQRVREISPKLDRLYLMFNNHYRGQSARNAREIATLLEQAR